MVQARSRIKINSPPLSKFNPEPVRKYWLKKGHQLCDTISENKIVIDRICLLRNLLNLFIFSFTYY